MLLRIDRLIPEDLLKDLQTRLAAAEFVDGRITAGIDARQVKHNRQLAPRSQLAEELGELVLKRIGGLPELVGVAFPQRISRPMFASYAPGMEYGLHVDNGVLQTRHGPIRSDIAMTIFLSPPESYEGGELLIEDIGLGHHRVKLPAGSAFAYPATSLHRVAPVTRGTRLACVLWIQSQIRDPGHRRILVDLDNAAGRLRERDPNSPELKLVLASYHNLLRLWADI
ncbi:MAG TPA: Fe2+-dependent dioxygenase [Acetobacteraceae bacterium]|nr:Fe2+-dependent dioxygenase [Acetobacteraceae bacterium]